MTGTGRGQTPALWPWIAKVVTFLAVLAYVLAWGFGWQIAAFVMVFGPLFLLVIGLWADGE